MSLSGRTDGAARQSTARRRRDCGGTGNPAPPRHDNHTGPLHIGGVSTATKGHAAPCAGANRAGLGWHPSGQGRAGANRARQPPRVWRPPSARGLPARPARRIGPPRTPRWTAAAIRLARAHPFASFPRPPRRTAPPAGPVAQWLEPTAHNGLVVGSSPTGPTSLFKVSSGTAERRSVAWGLEAAGTRAGVIGSGSARP